MHVALITVYSRRGCALKDVAGGYGTVFHVGDSLPARLLERAKTRLARLPSSTLGYVAALARDAGYAVSAHELQRGELGSDPAPSADVAVVLTSMVDAAAEAAVMRELRSAGTHVIAVGAHGSARPEVYLNGADVVVCGEPEALGHDLFHRDRRGTLDAGYVSDLDSLPFPDWSPFPIRRYRYALLSRHGATLPVSGARGCAYGCGYCPFRVTAPFRQRSAESVVAEVTDLVRRHGVRGVSFRDPLFNFDRARAIDIAHGLEPLGVRFSAEMRADRLDSELLGALYRAGLRSMEIGVESVDTAMLARERRTPPPTSLIEAVVADAHSLGIRVIANFILGLPDDSEQTFRATVAWAKRLNPFAVQFTVATPYPGTDLAERVRGLMLDVAPEAYTGWEPLFTHPSITHRRMRELREWAYVSYHARPRYALRFAHDVLGSLRD